MRSSTADPPAPLAPEIIAAAAHWAATLQSGTAGPDDEQACLRWRQAHPDHELAWARMQGIGRGLREDAGPLSPKVLRSSLGRTRRPRRGLLLLGALCVGAAPIGWRMAEENGLWPLRSDLHTGGGEQRVWALEDGTRIVLAPHTSVDRHFDEARRTLSLRRGLIEVSTAADPRQRELSVVTQAGHVLPRGTRFTVQADTRTRSVEVAVSVGAVELQPQAGEPARLMAGEVARFDPDGVGAIQPIDPGAFAWVDGLLIADRMRLSDVLAGLARYRRGYLDCDPTVADLRVTGSFPLASTDQALALLAETLPIRADTRLGFWTTVRAR